MAAPNPERKPLLGIFDRQASGSVSATEVIAAALSVLWLMGSVLFFLFAPATGPEGGFDSLNFLVTLMAVFLPVAVIWVAAAAARSNRIMREESRRLQATVEAMRKSYLADRQARALTAVQPMVEKKLDEIAASARQAEEAIVTFTSKRQPDPPRRPLRMEEIKPGANEQPALALGTQAEEFSEPLSREDFIQALNFPDTAEDEAGFTALRRALKDRSVAQLIHASQDVLTLLSQDGIYMDDLRPDRARPDIWRRFAAGERGRSVAPLGGVRDRTSLALTAGRMKQDPVFRDAAHHFLRRFDKVFSDFEETASDEEIIALSETRTARAFMLLGRVTGTFT
jgi:hypothetical protein